MEAIANQPAKNRVTGEDFFVNGKTRVLRLVFNICCYTFSRME